MVQNLLMRNLMTTAPGLVNTMKIVKSPEWMSESTRDHQLRLVCGKS